MTTMKAAVVTQFGTDDDVTEVERPTPGQHEALVKLISSGVCHTDLHAMEGDWPVKPTPPFIPGHEGVGIVEEVGPDVENLKVGDMVGNAWLWRAWATASTAAPGGRPCARSRSTAATPWTVRSVSTCSWMPATRP